MHLSTFVAVTAFGLGISCAPLERYVIHERRAIVPKAWQRGSPVHADLVVPVRFGLSQSNLEQGHDILMGLSDPDSPTYGKHWTASEVANFFAPASESYERVHEWLVAAGIEAADITRSAGWVNFKTSAGKLEELLQTKYHHYTHGPSGIRHIGCTEYSVPDHLKGHIDLVLPSVHFDVKPEKMLQYSPSYNQKRGLESGLKHGSPIKDPASVIEGLTTCDAVITPACLRALYGFPVGTLNKSSFAITEFAPETYLQTDLDLFWATAVTNDAGVPIGTAPIDDAIDGGFLEPITGSSFGVNGEPDLDLEYGMDLVYPQQVTLYQVGDNGTHAANISFNNWLDAISPHYCTYEGGDDPTYDESFPDPGTGGYKKKENCGTYKAAATISTSYAYNEHDLPLSYEKRQCSEYMKLGMMGSSFLFSSGDYGVAGNGGDCIDPTTGEYNNGTSGLFNPSFPGTCPYVTSVGATQIPIGATVTKPETACETVIYSGGGFSNNFAMPSYQKSAVKEYYAKNAPSYGADRYNNSTKARGFPDVAANGANYITAIDGTFMPVYGTSASAPTFASIITLINNERAKKGKASLGFLNPVFYKNPSMFNDIVSGGNQGCGTDGFTAVTGWDPVTGLGTPNYTKMLKVLG